MCEDSQTNRGQITFETEKEKQLCVYAIREEIKWLREYYPATDVVAMAAVADSEKHLQTILKIKPLR